MLRVVVGLFALALALASAAQVQAQVLRQPRSGEPALVLEVPADWTGRYDKYDNLQFSNADHHLNIQLCMMEGAGVGAVPLADLAARTFQEGGLPTYSRSQARSIDGRPGEAFFAQKTYDNGGKVDFVLVLVRLDATHVASVARITNHAVTDEQVASVDALLDSVRITGARD